MRVLCPFVSLHPKADEALRDHAPNADRIDVSESDFDYFDAILRRWTGDQDLMICEQDIALHVDVIPGFIACRRPWCLHTYDHMTLGHFIDTGLGCVRFTAELQQAVPFAMVLKAEAPVPGSWRHLDGQIAATMASYGMERHVHEPPVTHWNKHLRRPE